MYERTVQALGEEMDAYRRMNQLGSRIRRHRRNRALAWTGLWFSVIGFFIMTAVAPPFMWIVIPMSMIFVGALLYTSSGHQDYIDLVKEYEQAKINYDYMFDNTQKVYSDE